MPFIESDKLTFREAELLRQEKEEREAARSHEIQLKKLELELAKLELRWSQWFKIPLTILSIPIRMLGVLALCIAYVRKLEPSDQFWKFLR